MSLQDASADETIVARDAFAFLLNAYVAEHVPADPAGEFVRHIVKQRLQPKPKAATASAVVDPPAAITPQRRISTARGADTTAAALAKKREDGCVWAARAARKKKGEPFDEEAYRAAYRERHAEQGEGSAK